MCHALCFLDSYCRRRNINSSEVKHFCLDIVSLNLRHPAMFRNLGFYASGSQTSIQSSPSRTSTYTQSSSASSLPVTLSRSTSPSFRRKLSPHKYHTVILFLFALALFSLSSTLRLTAMAHAKYENITKGDNHTGTSSGDLRFAQTNEVKKVKADTISALSVHRIAEVLFEMVHNEEVKSLAVYPCHKHLDVLRFLSGLLSLESSQEKSLVICLDSSSAELAEAHSVMREERYSFDVKFIREDLTKKLPPKATILVRIDNENALDASSLRAFLISVKESGAQLAVVNALPNTNAKWNVESEYESAPFPLADHIQLIKTVESGFIVVYELLNMTQH
ncbi:hypothetical protein FGB62_5g49 [Gracilaria domingensis]|nr:hypothetical protein FGB62_5g49 [Gracilaria domingensis]